MQDDSTTNHTYRNTYVSAGPKQPVTDLVTANQVGAAIGGLMAAYREQQRAALDLSTGDNYAQPGNRQSTGSELAERRYTSFMYLLHQSGATALAVAGLVGLFWLSGNVQGVAAIAWWIAATGGLSLLLSFWQHNRELQLSPEALESERIAYDGDLSLYDAETRRMILVAEVDIRRAVQAQQSTEGERLQARLERRQRNISDKSETATYDDKSQRLRFPAEKFINDKLVDPTPETVSPLLATLLTTVAALYDRDPDGRMVRVSHDGRIDGRLPWSARGELPPVAKERVLAVLGCLNPPLIEQRAGGRYYLNVRHYPMQLALRALRAAW